MVFILCIVIIVAAALGIIGSLIIEILFLQLYLLLLVALFIWELIYIIISAVNNDYCCGNGNRLGYDIVVLVLLFLAAACTSHLITRSMWGGRTAVSTVIV